MAKPVILCVDDDEEVLGAIERDLRSHFGGAYRIVRANSAREALAAARQLKQRGASIALLVADQRMPEMTGTEFLNEARKLHPEARKVLLTAYADTEAAITSINEIGLDYYLMKPWDPPEQKLFPALDDLIGQWTSKVRLPYDGIRLIGAETSPQSYAAKEFLSLNQVPYQWVDIDRDESARVLTTSPAGEQSALPVVLFPDGTVLTAPTNLELAEKCGLQTTAKLPFYDLIVIGGGPAGLANALYGASEGLRTLLVEQNAPGGQAGTSSHIENYLGFPAGVTGADLTQRATAQARRFGAELLTAQEAVGLRRADPYRIVTLSDGSEVSAYTVLIATGMSVRVLDAEGIEPLLGVGVYYGAAMTEAARYRGKHVCIVGGANSAGQGALFFARYAAKVSILVRAASLRPAMSQYLVSRIQATENIEIVTGVEVKSVRGKEGLEQITLSGDAPDRTLDVEAMFVFIGTKPRSDIFGGSLVCNDKGFILTGLDLPKVDGRFHGWTLDRDPFNFETTIPGVFAAGDVRAGANRRVAAAVGEGSAAIYSIQRYLLTV